jgi:16S rRNA (cytidine1402-2'-O)-methyltransferase
MSKGNIFLIPVPIHNEDEFDNDLIPPIIIKTINILNYFVVENIRTSRRFIKKVSPSFDIDNCQFEILNKRTEKYTIDKIINDVINGVSIGLMSEAGCPGIADPGNEICKLAHENNINVKPLIGPSSIILALMASGLNGQNFSFHGYLPINKEERIKKIKLLNRIKGSHIFIETPYRNNQLLEDLINHINPSSKKLTLAINLSGKEEKIITKTINQMKNITLDLRKQPTIFIFE